MTVNLPHLRCTKPAATAVALSVVVSHWTAFDIMNLINTFVADTVKCVKMCIQSDPVKEPLVWFLKTIFTINNNNNCFITLKLSLCHTLADMIFFLKHSLDSDKIEWDVPLSEASLYLENCKRASWCKKIDVCNPSAYFICNNREAKFYLSQRPSSVFVQAIYWFFTKSICGFISTDNDS